MLIVSQPYKNVNSMRNCSELMKLLTRTIEILSHRERLSCKLHMLIIRSWLLSIDKFLKRRKSYSYKYKTCELRILLSRLSQPSWNKTLRLLRKSTNVSRRSTASCLLISKIWKQQKRSLSLSTGSWVRSSSKMIIDPRRCETAGSVRSQTWRHEW